MQSGCSDSHRSLSNDMTFDMSKVYLRLSLECIELIEGLAYGQGRDAFLSDDMIDDLREMCDGIDSNISDIFEFIAIVCWDEEGMISLSDSIQDGGQESVYPLHHPIQTEFSEK